MRLKEITISAFRGFNEKQTLNLDNNIILIKGSNGSGKSSLVEAIEWLFFDEISRKKKSLCKSEYSGEFLRNIHSSKEQETFVELLVDIEGKEVLLKKMLLSPEKKEYYANGSFVDDFSCLGVSSADVYKPILSQVEVKHYVETDPKDRYEETNKILGLGILAELRTDLQELQKLKKVDSKYQISRKIYDGLECDLKELAFENLWIEMARRPFLEKAFENSLIETITKIYSVEFTSIENLGETLDKEFKKLAQISDNSEIAQMTMSSNKSILKLPSLLIEEIKQLSELLKQLKPVKAELYSFLETGKDLIVEMTCPFCQEKTLTPEKRKELDTRIHSLQEAGIVLSNARSQISKICLLKDEFNGQHQIFPDTSSLEKIAARIADNGNYSDEIEKIDSIRKKIDVLNKNINALNNELKTLIEDANNVADGKSEFQEAKTAAEIRSAEDLANLSQKGMEKLEEDTQSIMSSIVSKAPCLSAQEKQELKRYVLLKKLIDHRVDIKYVGVFENNLNTISILVEEVERFEKTKSEKQLSKLNQKIKEFYERLNPDEKTQFSEISSKGSRKIQIKAVSHGKDMNPVSCFSEAHMNCLCLSIYFSQRVLKNPYWDFVVLDDPVQSMDEDHGKNLIRVLDEVHETKQVIVASHNSAFCHDFRDLFYGRDYLFYEFSGNSIEGPSIDLKQALFETYISIAKKYHNGNSEERAISGNNLRKAIERFTADVLIFKGKLSYKRTYDMKLEERLEKLETTRLFTLEEIGEIKGMLKICDSASHERPEREVASTELRDGISTLQTLFAKHLK